MKRFSLCLLSFPFTAILFAPISRADLSADIRAILADKALAKGQAGVEVLRLDESGKSDVIFHHDSDVPLMPASNLKLVTTSAFLEHFGPDFKFRTLLAQRGDDVIVVGDGDPSFGDAELLKKSGWESTTVFTSWAQGLAQRGIKSVGNVIVDDSIFDQDFVNADWPVKQQHFRYVAGVGGMNFNANALDFFLRTGSLGTPVTYVTDPPTHYVSVRNDCVSGKENAVWLSRQPNTNELELRGTAVANNQVPVSVSIYDPPLFAATVLAETLTTQGITVKGTVSRERDVRDQLLNAAPATQPAGAKPTIFAVHETPIATVLARANKDSMNLYAESMAKRLGADVAHESGSWANATAAMGAFVKSCGVSDSEFSFDDGCGLSRKNAVSANAIAHVLAHDYASKNRDIFLASLSVAGFDGTLDNRFRDSDLRGRVFAKSGFITGVSALSGFVKTKDGQPFAFSIIMNGVGDVATCKVLQERIVKAIDASAAQRVAAGE